MRRLACDGTVYPARRTPTGGHGSILTNLRGELTVLVLSKLHIALLWLPPCISLAVLMASLLVKLTSKVYRKANARVQIPHTVEDDRAEPDSIVQLVEDNIIRKNILQEGIVWPEALEILGLAADPTLARISLTEDILPLARIRTSSCAKPRPSFRSTTVNNILSRLDLAKTLLSILLLACLVLRVSSGGAARTSLISAHAYTVLLLLFRHYSNFANRARFRSKASDCLTAHIIPMTFATSTALPFQLYWNCTHHQSPARRDFQLTTSATVLAVAIFMLEIATPRKSNFVSLEDYREEVTDATNSQSEETESLLPQNEDDSVDSPSGTLRTLAPELGTSIVSRITFSYINCKLFSPAKRKSSDELSICKLSSSSMLECLLRWSQYQIYDQTTKPLLLFSNIERTFVKMRLGYLYLVFKYNLQSSYACSSTFGLQS